MTNRYIFLLDGFFCEVSSFLELGSDLDFLLVFDMYICASCSRKDEQDSLLGIKGSKTHKTFEMNLS